MSGNFEPRLVQAHEAQPQRTTYVPMESNRASWLVKEALRPATMMMGDRSQMGSPSSCASKIEWPCDSHVTSV